MGQRHQAFVIARVRPHGDASAPPKYRCIAAFHHQWCYGALALEAAHRFITLVKQKDNAEIIAAEIEAIQGRYGRWREAPKIPRVPAPVVGLLLATSWSVDLEADDAPYASGVSFENGFLHAGMGSSQGDNNEGITIIDVTDPTDPAYCFNAIGGLPKSAKQYSPRSREAIALLKDVKMVTIEMLAEAWPAEYRKALAYAQKKAGPTPPVEDDEPLAVSLPSMVDMTLTIALANALETGETSELEAMMWRPDMMVAVRASLRERLSFPDSGIPLLRIVIDKELEEDKTALDLSKFALTSAQIAQLASTWSGLETLNLSYNSTITIDAVSIVLNAIPNLQRLVLLGCPAISNDDMYKLTESEPALFYRIGALIHPAFLAVLNDTRDECPYATPFTYFGFDSWARSCALPYFTPAGVVQSLTALLGSFARESQNPFAPMQIMQASFVPQSLFSAAPLRPRQSWAEKSVALVPQMSLKFLRGEGWAFCLKYGSFKADNAYGFVRVLDKKFDLVGGGPYSGDTEEPEGADRSQGDDGQEGDIREDGNDRKDCGDGKEGGEEGTEDAVSGLVKAVEKLELEPKPFAEILDLKSFLERMEAEGRPRPPTEDVEKLEGIFKSLETGDTPLRLFEEAAFITFVRRAYMNAHMLY